VIHRDVIYRDVKYVIDCQTCDMLSLVGDTQRDGGRMFVFDHC